MLHSVTIGNWPLRYRLIYGGDDTPIKLLPRSHISHIIINRTVEAERRLSPAENKNEIRPGDLKLFGNSKINRE